MSHITYALEVIFRRTQWFITNCSISFFSICSCYLKGKHEASFWSKVQNSGFQRVNPYYLNYLTVTAIVDILFLCTIVLQALTMPFELVAWLLFSGLHYVNSCAVLYFMFLASFWQETLSGFGFQHSRIWKPYHTDFVINAYTSTAADTWAKRSSRPTNNEYDYFH